MAVQSPSPVSRRSKVNRLALASFVLGITGVMTVPIPIIPSCVVGWIGVLFGFIALWQIRKWGGRSWDLVFAFLGILTGLLPMAGWCALIYAVVKGLQMH
jgi:hypothetical protein